MVVIYMLVFSQVMGARLAGANQENSFSYGIYLIAGILPWMAFQNTILRSGSIFTEKKGIITKLPINLVVLPFTVLLSETFTFALTLVVYLMFLLVVGADFTWWMLCVPLFYLTHQAVAYGLGLWLATFNVFMRDIKEAFNILFQVWFWFTPIVYPIVILPDQFRNYLYFNPAVAKVDSYHSVFVYTQAPNFVALGITAAVGCALTLSGLWVFGKLEKDVRDFL
jgi:lipopolysaccharide transport system permease protein